MDEKERSLIKEAKCGDHRAFGQLFKDNYPFLVKYLIKVTMNPDTAQDLAQETMMKSMENIQLFKGQSKFSSWLISIATNLYIDQMRKKKREQDWVGNEQTFRKLKWHLESHNEEWNDALSALGKLTDDFRIPIILKHYYGYSYDEIAEMIKIPTGTVKSRIHNGLTAVRRELKIHEEAKKRRIGEK